jgi:hypothetical protein
VTTDEIQAVWIDEDGRLFVTPRSHQFPFIYREAVDVHWDAEQASLCSPVPREWSYLDWFKQILAAARMQGVVLQASPATEWQLPPEIRCEIHEWLSAPGP